MGLSTAGSEGLILAGAAQTESASGSASPSTAYVMKTATSDGHVLWRWQPDPASPTRGRIWSTAVDHDGNILVVGTSGGTASEVPRLLEAKLDGSTGNVIWRSSGIVGGRGYDVRVDANDDVLVTSSDPPGTQGLASVGALPWTTMQRVEKFGGATGALIWSTALPDGLNDQDDFRIALDGAGDVITAGHYEIQGPNATYIHGTRVAKIRATDGALTWEYRSVDADAFGRANALAILDDGDPILLSSQGMTRLSANGGAIVWDRSDVGELATVVVGAGDALYAAGPRGSFSRGVLGTAVNVARVDSLSGAFVWTGSLADGDALASELTISRSGNLLVGWQRLAATNNLGLASVDGETGFVRQSIDFGTANTSPGHVVGIVEAADGGIMVGSALHGVQADGQTFTVTRIDSSFVDRVFGNGFD
jgi:hypothetical protein